MVGDKRNYLYKHYAEFLKKYEPEYFVFENVLGLLSAKDEDESLHFENMQKLFKQYGYSTEFLPLNALGGTVLVVSHGNVAEGYPHKLVITKENGESRIGE